jgi:hypothetical protein
MPSPKSGKAGKIVPPAAPGEIVEADVADPGQVAPAFFGVWVVPENQPDEIVRRELDQGLLMIPGDDVVGGADDPGEVVHIIPVPFKRLDGYHFFASLPAVKV